jgi:superfamily II DNA or RNA helicase/HKD family nuclease
MVTGPAILNEASLIESSGIELQNLEGIRPLYFLPNDPLADEVLIPGFQVAASVDCMAGFFSSEVLASLVPGLATYIASSQNSFRLIVSPLLRSEDKEAIENGLKSAEEVSNEILEDLIVTEDLLQCHTLKCLSWLIREGRIEIKIALMKDALFHPKVWLFKSKEDILAAHGSSNMTYSGIRKNIEQVAISKSWEDRIQEYTANKFAKQFHNFWEDKEDNCTVVPMSRAIQQRIVRSYSSNIPPSEEELRALYKRASGISEEPETYDLLIPVTTNSFAIPKELRFEDGPFEHQGKAVEAWCEAGYRGILEMATGSGKTITSMICAYRLYELHKPLLIVVSAPYIPLIQQWCDELELFGLRPVNMTMTAGRRGRAISLNRIKRRLQNGKSEVEVVVVSHRTLCDSNFIDELEKFNCPRLLIADEAHNLGSEGFISNPPVFFEYKLGLSATPVRQYDEEGTTALFDFFGSVVFQFTLQEAIGHCLVEYDYHLHPVKLTDDEMDKWYDLTAKIKANSWRQENNKPDEYLAKLLRDRRALLETARNKITSLKNALNSEKIRELRHTLIYASDKDPEQLKQVNALLKAQGVLFHQLTYEETGNQEETARIIRSFREGTLRILTAKRVLDEGVNIPEIQKAFILASTTVERQWVQRRGRLLRTCREIGKTHSEVHDFIALPPDLEILDDDAKTLIRTELFRVQEFASLARNAGRVDGPLEMIYKLVNKVIN